MLIAYRPGAGLSGNKSDPAWSLPSLARRLPRTGAEGMEVPVPSSLHEQLLQT